MERCILGSSRYGAWIDVKKHHKVFIYQKLLFTLWCLNLIEARAAYIGFFLCPYITCISLQNIYCTVSGCRNTLGVLLLRLRQHVVQFFLLSKIIAMLELILSKKSSESEIKSYFNAVLELSKSDNEFPINLDEVWMLVYGRKEEAVRALTSSEQFIENIDYQVLRKNAENQKGGRPTNEYKLTVSCMEFFIARKVRPVFEVYRQVFHKVAKHELSRKELALMVIQAEEEKERLALENEKQQKQIEKL